MTKRIEPTVTIPTALLADICGVIDYHYGMAGDHGLSKGDEKHLERLLARCEDALLESDKETKASGEMCQVLIITEREEFRAIKREIADNQSAMVENITDFEKTKKIGATLDELYSKLGVLCANHCVETWIK